MKLNVYFPLTLGLSIHSAFADTVLSEVIVKGTVDIQDERRMASAAKMIIDHKEIAATDASTVAELLNKLPMTGMFMEPPMSGAPKRGQGGQNRNMPQILVDGQSLGGGNNMGTVMRLPVELIERVEIIRNSTPEFLVTSPAGVINIILKDVPKQLTRNAKLSNFIADGRLGVRVDGQYGQSQDNYGYLLAGAADSKPQIGERISTINEISQAKIIQETTHQTRRNNNVSLSPRFNIKLENNQQIIISPFVAYNQDQREVHTQHGNSTISQELDMNDAECLTARFITEWKQQGQQNNEQSIKLFVQAEDENTDKTTYKTLQTGSQSTSQENTERTEREVALDGRIKRLLLDAHIVTSGVEWRSKETKEEYQQQQVLTNNSQIKEQRVALWWQDEWLLSEKHTLTYGMRWQQIDNKIDDNQQGLIQQKEDIFAPSIHYLWQPNEQWNVRASVAQHQRPARASELSSVLRTASGVNSSSNPDRAGNPQLANEKQYSLELGIEHYLPQKAGNVSFSLFERQVSDYVQRLTLLENGRWLERPYNVGDARLRGVILDSKVQLSALQLPNMMLRGSYAYSQNSLTNAVANLGAGEGGRQTVNVGLEYKLNSLTLGTSANYISAIDRESSMTVRQVQGSQKVANAYVSYKANKQFSLRLAMNNVLAEDRTDTLYEYDLQGQLKRMEQDVMKTYANVILSVDGRW